MNKFLIKTSLSCGCRKKWFILADSYSIAFEIEKAVQFIERANHRLHECELSPVHLREGRL